jgi:ectoine hydroxylase-related dioxygenase (phytanoyl-CoA dioxygenase family)
MMRFDCHDAPAGSPDFPKWIDGAADCLSRHGYLILDNVLPRAFVEALDRDFLGTYGRFLKDEDSDEARKVGFQRYMLALEFAGRFGDPAVFANPHVLPVIRHVMGNSALVEAYGAIVSLPGAAAQPQHFDGPHLFGTDLTTMLPAYAVTCGLPLVEMNEEHGTTCIRPGSHRWRQDDQEGPTLAPRIPVGSCLIWDFRLRHFGTANRSAVPRPLLYCTYARPWFKDPVNFLEKKRLRRLAFAPSFLETLPEDLRPLLAHAT